ncbi:hypothetical protein V6N11_068025 [Hibiscus sabdariffa]|uniref:Integrase catalytic domain-containing protein n=1 Tax=Hibiscus sabdariffa TaxID=183260 RepID=A0ABR2SSI1_9ROSI
MRETETVKEYSDRLVSIANKVRLLGSTLADSRIVQKILVAIPERYEATITTLENTRDMSKITLAELLSALQAQEQRRVMRQEGAIEGALPVKHQDDGKNRRPKNRKFHSASGENSTFGNKKLKSTESKNVRIGNGENIAVKGKGTVAIASCSGTKFITDVLYVPDIDQNLLSVGQLVENGFKVKFMEKTCVIENATCQKMFEVEMGIVQMKSKSMAIDLPEFDDRILTCKACQFGKQNKKSFPKTTWRATCKLQLIHTDISGPQRTLSLAGNRYYAAFIDDFTRMCWIFFLKFKSEVAGAFWKFKRIVENQSGNHIQILRSDNGKEYTSNNFNAFCEEAGIEHQLTAPYSPQQNEVSERRNKYILEMTRCMLHEKNLPKKFWAESAHTAVFLQNRFPTKVVKDQTPYEAWYGCKPFLHYERHKMGGCRFCYSNGKAQNVWLQ